MELQGERWKSGIASAILALGKHQAGLGVAGTAGGIDDRKRLVKKIEKASCTILPKDFWRYVAIEYSGDTGKYFVVGKDYDPDIDEVRETPITMADFFYEAEEAAWKWIEAGPRRPKENP